MIYHSSSSGGAIATLTFNELILPLKSSVQSLPVNVVPIESAAVSDNQSGTCCLACDNILAN